MFRHWHTIALTLILASVTALLINAEPAAATTVLSRGTGTLAALALLILVYIIARGLVGEAWAMLPVMMLGFAPLFLAYSSQGVPGVAPALAFLAAVWTFAHFVEHPSRLGLIIAGITFGLLLLTHPLGFIVAGAHIALAFAALTTSIAVDWSATGPEMRRHRFLIRAMRYARGTFVVLCIGLTLAYLFYAVIGDATPAPEDAPLIIAWLMDNAALRPLGAYFLSVTQYIGGLPPFNWNFPLAFALALPLPLLGLFAIALWSAITDAFGNALESIVAKTPLLLNYIATNPVGLALQLGAAFILIAGFRAASGNDALMLTLPFLTLLSASAVKRWFVVVDEALMRNALLRMLLLAQNIWSVSLKALALALLLMATIITAIIAAPEFSTYTNLIGALL